MDGERKNSEGYQRQGGPGVEKLWWDQKKSVQGDRIGLENDNLRQKRLPELSTKLEVKSVQIDIQKNRSYIFYNQHL